MIKQDIKTDQLNKDLVTCHYNIVKNKCYD